MKTDKNLCKFATAARLDATVVPLVIMLGLSGCEGGLVGTGTGPSNEVYQLENLPERISPNIPKTILKGEELAPAKPGNSDTSVFEIDVSPRVDDSVSEKSQGWLEINGELFLANYIRLLAESNATIIDLVFDDIRTECAEQLINCTIPSDQIRVTITQDVVNRLIQLHSEWAASVPPSIPIADDGVDIVELINANFTALLNQEFVLGETQYSQLDGAPYSHAVETFLKPGLGQSEGLLLPRLKDVQFSARWHDDGHVAKFSASTENISNTEYFYENNVPSEIVIASYIPTDDEQSPPGGFYVKLIGNEPQSAGILVEVVSAGKVYGAASTSTSSISTPDSADGSGTETQTTVNIEFEDPSDSAIDETFAASFQGRMDNSGGYSLYDDRIFDVNADGALSFYAGYRESFDSFGNLIAGEQCIVFDVISQRDDFCHEDGFESYGPIGNAITDSVFYFEPDGFDSLTAIQDVIRWKVEGLPTEITDFAVVSADSAIVLSQREKLCRGFQHVSEDVRIFCSATDGQLDNTVVVELDNGIPRQVIPTAALIQIQ